MADRLFRIAAILGLMICHSATASAQTVDDRVSFGDWERSCTPDGVCVLSQVNADAQTDDIRMRTEVSVVADDQVLMSVIVPDGVLLTEGPWLTVDGVFVGPLNYVRCQTGCLARIMFTQAQFSLVSNGNRGAITVTARGQRIGIVVSFDGLAAGITSVRELGRN